jgi:CPA2 family monovalent cation:H+ antiporter-2
VQKQRELGRTIIFGDVSDPEVLENAGIHHADALVLTVPDEDAVFRACRVARSLNPSVFIIARTNFLSRALVAMGLGANETVVEEMATAEAMDRLIQRVLGGPESVIETGPATAASAPQG